MDKKQLKSLINDKNSIFFAGIGGISMSSLAADAKNRGKTVAGSDIALSKRTKNLEQLGIKVFEGHHKENIENCELLVYSNAVDNGNPEITEAKKCGIPVISRAEYLGALMLDSKTRIGISGSHGKSTVTAMVTHALLAAGRDPSVFCGADIPELNGPFRRGTGEFLFEACEYRKSFLKFCPNVAVILNTDYDHPDFYRTPDDYVKAFSEFASISSEDGGSIIINSDDEGALKATSKEYPVTFGIKKEADYSAKNIKENKGFFSFDVYKFDEPFISIKLAVPGYHHIYNALASVSVLDLLGINPETIKTALCDYSSLGRRFEKKCELNGAAVYSDYAHHPTEIKAVIETAKLMTGGRVVAVFEPHTYSRTKKFYGDFVKSLKCADTAVLTDIFPARETDTLGMSSKKLADAVNGTYAGTYEKAAEVLKNTVKAGDTVLLLGAGTIDSLSKLLGE